VKLGAHFLPEDFPVFVESVQAAERAGYERAWLVDGQMLWQDLYVYMTHALAATERIVVGSGVTNPLTRHPAVTASAHATLADLHPGRVVLGIGRGDNAVRTLGHKPVPTAELAETVPRLRAWMAGEDAAAVLYQLSDVSEIDRGAFAVGCGGGARAEERRARMTGAGLLLHGGGPTQVNPASITASANSGLSERKP